MFKWLKEFIFTSQVEYKEFSLEQILKILRRSDFVATFAVNLVNLVGYNYSLYRHSTVEIETFKYLIATYVY